MKITKEGAQSLRMKMRNAELYLKEATVIYGFHIGTGIGIVCLSRHLVRQVSVKESFGCPFLNSWLREA